MFYTVLKTYKKNIISTGDLANHTISMKNKFTSHPQSLLVFSTRSNSECFDWSWVFFCFFFKNGTLFILGIPLQNFRVYTRSYIRSDLTNPRREAGPVSSFSKANKQDPSSFIRHGLLVWKAALKCTGLLQTFLQQLGLRLHYTR